MSHVVSMLSSGLLISLPPLSSSSSFLYLIPICIQLPSFTSSITFIYIHLYHLLYTYSVSIYSVSHSLLPLDFHFHSHLLAYTSMPFLLLHNPLTQWTTEKAFSPFY